MRVSDKGQITIPKSMREVAGIRPNSEVLMSLDGSRVIIEAQPDGQKAAEQTARIDRFLKSLQALEGTGAQDMDADAVMRATRDRQDP